MNLAHKNHLFMVAKFCLARAKSLKIKFIFKNLAKGA